MTKQKNIVGDLHNVHYARIGDEIHFHLGEPVFPKELTLNIPRTNQEDIIGRGSDLTALHNSLHREKRVVVVNGIGGIGKTTLARAYISRYYEEYRHIVWITQDSDDIAKDFASTAGLVHNLNINSALAGPEALFPEIIRKLKSITARPNLLIIDNGERSLKRYRDMLPAQPNWHLLVTSRETITGFHHQPLGFLDDKQAFALFKKHYPYNTINNAGIKQLVKAVDYHTLTIEIMAKMAALQRYDLAALRKAIQKDLKANVEITHNRHSKPIEKIGSYLQTTFTLSHLSEPELWLLKQFTCLPPEPQSYQRVRALLVDEQGDHAACFAETLMRLSDKGWLSHHAGADTYDMHRIIAGVVRKERPVALNDVTRLLSVITDKLHVDFTADNALDRFEWVPYGKALLAVFPRSTSPEIACLQNRLGFVLLPLNELDYAKNILEKALRSDTKNFGKDHPTTTMHINNLALIYREQGDLKTARKMLERAAQNDERNLGPMHNHTALRYHNLGLILCELGDYKAAQKMVEHVIKIRLKTFGLIHPSTARAYGTLARILREQGKTDDARSLIRKAIRSDEQYYGKGHPAITGFYHTLGIYLYDEMKFTEAEKLLEKVVIATEQVYGQANRKTAIAYNDLALVLSGKKNHKAAKSLFEKALHIHETYLPDDLEEIATVARNLALVLSDMGDNKTAVVTLKKAIRFYEKTRGPHHDFTILAYADLAAIYVELDNYRSALPLQEKVVRWAEKNLHKNDLQLAIYRYNLGVTCFELDNHDRSRDLINKAVLIYKKHYPPRSKDLLGPLKMQALLQRKNKVQRSSLC
jgi:tetratricopeptide (TPR) repeat protein